MKKNNPKVMVLGAGVYQVPIIKKAKQKGYEVIVVSWKGNYPGFKYADMIYYEDAKNYRKVLEIAEKERIDGIVTTGTDVPVISIGYVNDMMSLCGVSKEGAMLATNKLEMKRKFESANVRSARFRTVRVLDEAEEAFSELEKPVVFKAVDSSGSRGIVKVSASDEIEAAFSEVMACTRKEYFIIEEFIEGWEFGAQAFIKNHELVFLLPHDDELFFGKTAVPVGHSAPIDIPETLDADIRVQIQRSVNALQLNNCALNVDFIVRDGKVYVLEVGARAGATCLPELVEITYGVDYYSYILETALGRDPKFEVKQNQPNASLLIYSDREGVLREIINANEETDENILDVSFDYKIGDRINRFQVGPDRIGQIIVKGGTLKQAKEKVQEVRSNITLKVE